MSNPISTQQARTTSAAVTSTSPPPQAQKHHKFALSLFVLSAALYMLLDARGFSGGWMAALKIVPIYLLVKIAAQRLKGTCRNLTLIALAFSALGDVLLALDIPNHFILGLGAFLLAQLTYAVNFARSAEFFRLRFVLRAIPLLVVAALVAVQLLPAAGTLSTAVALYLVAILAMALAAAAHRGDSTLLFIGAIVFVTSDALIAVNRFLLPLPLASIGIMLTYYGAQLALLFGIARVQA